MEEEEVSTLHVFFGFSYSNNTEGSWMKKKTGEAQKNNNYNTNRRIYLNLSKSIQSAAWLSVEACCQWAVLNVQIMTLL